MKSVFITRDLVQDDLLCLALTQQGARVISKSLITLAPVHFENIPTADWVFFYSKNAAKYFYQQTETASVRHLKIGTIGEATANYIERNFGLKCHFIGTGVPDATAIAFKHIAANAVVLFPRAKNSKQSIQLRIEHDIVVKDLIVYDNDVLQGYIPPATDIVVFTSPLNVKSYFQSTFFQNNQWAVAIGQTTATALEQYAVKNIYIADMPSEKGLIRAVLACLSM